MKVVLVTLSNNLYADSRARLCASAQAFGIPESIAYDFEDIKKHSFYYKNRNLLDNKKYMGFWLWKPFIIAETLATLHEGDVLIYMDSGIEIIASLEPLIDLCKSSEPVLLFGNASDINANWTKRDTFVMMDSDEEVYWFGPHCDASVSFYRKSEETTTFVQQWLEYSSNENILSNLPNICKLDNIEGFQDHRHDQSVLSLLAQKHKINLYRIPSQFGNHYKMYDFRVADELNYINQADQRQLSYYSAIPYYNSKYGQLLNHHRTKNKTIDNQSSESIVSNNKYFNFLRRIRTKIKSLL